jgi:hypothetical protein
MRPSGEQSRRVARALKTRTPGLGQLGVAPALARQGEGPVEAAREPTREGHKLRARSARERWAFWAGRRPRAGGAGTCASGQHAARCYRVVIGRTFACQVLKEDDCGSKTMGGRRPVEATRLSLQGPRLWARAVAAGQSAAGETQSGAQAMRGVSKRRDLLTSARRYHVAVRHEQRRPHASEASVASSVECRGGPA